MDGQAGLIGVRWTRQALADLDDACAWTAAHRPAGEAEALALRLAAAIEALREFPERGRPGRLEGTRELVVPRTSFLIPYRLRDRHIEVIAILHGARAWPPR